MIADARSPRPAWLGWVAVVLPIGLAGCQVTPHQAPAHWNVLDRMEAWLPADANNVNYVLTRMEFGRTAISLGCCARAKPRLKEAYDQFEAQKSNTAAAISSESYKFYRGETYEQAMLCVYLGYIEYLLGNYNDARIYFTRATECDKGAVIKEQTPPSYGDDFALAFYWLSRASAKLGNTDNARIAMAKAAVDVERKPKDLQQERAADAAFALKMEKRRLEGEKWVWATFRQAKKPPVACPEMQDLSACCERPAKPDHAAIKRASNREEFFSAAFQEQVNLLAMIEVGSPPYKYLAGMHQERTEIGRPTCLPAEVHVYVDDQYAGPGYRILDLWDQAATQDRLADKDAAQAGKAVAKEILRHLPYFGNLAAHWNVSGDIRQWRSLPGRVYLFAARVPTGAHSIRVEVCDSNGRWLPRWSTATHGVTAGDKGETCVILKPYYDHDNQLSPEKRKAAFQAGARGWSEEFIVPRGYGY